MRRPVVVAADQARMECALLAGVVTAAVSFCALWDQKMSN